MTVIYEWDVETVTTTATKENDKGDVLDHRFCKSFAEAKTVAAEPPESGCETQIVLCRQDDQTYGWAYLVDGQLPGYFEDAYGNDFGKVPQRFLREVAAAVPQRLGR